MINLIETLFGLAIVGAIAAVVLRVRGNRTHSRQVTIGAVVSLVVATALEIYVRL